MKKIYFILSLLCLSASVNAQTAASYSYVPLPSPFTSIAATGTPVPALSGDDVTEPGIPIGFSFTYCGTPYTTLSACSNGWVSFTGSSSVEWDNFEGFIDGPGWLMPFWDDLDGTSGTAYYLTTGTAPSRIFTFEWNNWETVFGSGIGSFQVRLYEGSNIVDFHYGPSTISGMDATIGISNDNISDWQTLADESAAPAVLASPLFETLIPATTPVDRLHRWTPSSCPVSPITGPTSICTGGVTIVFSATPGCLWSSSTPSVATIAAGTGTIVGISAGTTTISYVSPLGCYATTVFTVTPTPPITGSVLLCTGVPVTYTHPTPGGTWTSSNVTIATVGSGTGIVTPIAPGTAKITYTMAGGCKSTAFITVNLSPAPITGTFVICQGSSATLSTTSSGGVWSSSFSSVASIDATGTMTGVLGGAATISYTLPSGCASIAPVTVNPLPAPITGGTSLCILGTSLLSSSTTGGTWSSTDPAIASIDASTGLVTAGPTAGSAVISYVLPSGCFATTTVNVVVVIDPITGPPVVCRYQNHTYSTATPGGVWTSSDVAVGGIGASSGLFVPVTAGTTTLTYTLGSGCFTIMTVTVNPNDYIFGIATVCQGLTMTMSNTVAGGTWSSSDASIFTVDPSTGVVTGVAGGAATISYTNTYGCIMNTGVTVFPTPAAISGDLHICVGNNTTLSSATTGGTWFSSDGAVATIDASGSVAAIASGTSGITYTSADGCITTAVFSVDPVPAPITGVMILCPTYTSLLTQPVTGGTWSSSDATMVSVGSSSGVLTGVFVSGGTATITYTLPVSGCVTTRVATVSPAPIISVTGPTTICVGTNTTFGSSMLGSTWASSNVAVATVGSSSGTVTGVSAGTATITCFGSNGCTSTIVVSVNANPSAITGTAVICVNATTTLNSTPAGVWSTSSGAIATVNASGVVTGVSANTVTISYTLPSGCFTTRIVTVNALPNVIGGTASVCVGLTTTLTSAPAGTWTSAATTIATVGSSTGVVTGVAAGNANITYTIPSGCFRVRTVTVNSLPGTFGGSPSLCPGTNVTLTNSTPGGTWSSSVPAVATIVSGTGVVTGIAGGTTTITYTLGTGCIATLTVTVINAPVAAITPIGDTVLCPGDFVTLTSSAAPGVTYQWYVGSVSIPAATTATYVASTAGSYQVRVSVAVGCSSLSVPMAVSVVPATATITVPGGSTTTCSGTAVALNANTGAGLTYQWLLGSSPITGATASTHNALIGGSYTVRVTNSAGCWAVSSPTMITVNPAPSNVVTISGPTTICAGNSVTFTAASGTGYTYQWHNSAGAIAGATSMSYTATATENYHVVITDGLGCTTTTVDIAVIVNPMPDVTITPGGPRIFCVGGTVALDAATGYAYQWYRNGTAITGATNDTYTASIAGGYRVRVTDLVTGCSAMTGADTVVTTVGTPIIIPLTPAKFCWGGSSLLSTNVSYLGSTITYQWFFNGVLIPGAASPTYNATVAGDYSARIIVPSSCSALTSSITVVQAPLPDPPITFNGTSFQTATYYVTYQWYKNLIPIPGATAFSTPASTNGSYKVAVTDTNGCQAMSAIYVLTGWTPPPPPTGVANVNSTDIKIFPNPASEKIFIEAPMNVRAVISGVDGKTLVDQENAKEISLKGFANGLYMITLFDDNGQQMKVQKIVKQ